MIIRFAIAAIFLSFPTIAAAQDLQAYQQRQRDLAALSELFGELHHIRRTCEPRYEADTWRDQMKKLLELEEPQASEREAMVQRFNKGYRGAQRRFPACDRRARDYAAGRAEQGEAIVARLTESLKQTGDDAPGASPFWLTPAPGKNEQ